jgi:hypothetical protein
MRWPTFDYEGVRRVSYDGACFVPVCPRCGRFVRVDEWIALHEEAPVVRAPNATCSLHGRVNMPFEGFV